MKTARTLFLSTVVIGAAWFPSASFAQDANNPASPDSPPSSPAAPSLKPEMTVPALPADVKVPSQSGTHAVTGEPQGSNAPTAVPGSNAPAAVPSSSAPAAVPSSSAPAAVLNFGAPAAVPISGAPAAVPAKAPVTATKASSVKGEPGSIKGVVKNLDGEPVADATVEIAKVGASHKRFETKTNAKGEFAFNNIDAGDWNVSFAARGMLSAQERTTVASSLTTELARDLEEIEASDVLRVTGKRTLVHAENTGTRTNLDRQFLNDYGSGNDLRQDIESTPGVIRDSVGNIITRGEHNAVNFELDGVILPEAPGVLSQSQFANPRSLESVNVDIGGYQAKDGGGPLGALVRMKSLPIPDKPVFKFGGQLGGPINGSLTYYAAGPLSKNSNSILSKVKFESSGTVTAAKSLGIEPPSKNYARNARADMNFLTKVEFQPTERDKFKLTVGLNNSNLAWPTKQSSYKAGVRIKETDQENFVILGYKRLGKKYFDEATLNIVNAFYSQKLRSSNVFDPTPNLVGDEPLLMSTAANAKRFNYIMSAQGEIKKKYFNQHNVSLGFLSEVRPVQTNYSAFYYNLDGNVGPIGALISPITGTFDGPQFLGNTGNYKGMRYLQSAYLQDSWRPNRGALKRLSVDAGVRLDVYHGVFGNTMRVANLISQVPGAAPFDIRPFQAQRVTDAQVSGRFGGSYALTNSTVVRSSFAQLFQPPPVDQFSTPFNISDGTVGGIYPGTIRPLSATRGQLVDASIEQQMGPRFAVRTNVFYKKLKNFGDSGVVQNTPLYNRLTLSGQEAYGVESRLDLKPARDGFGFNGFVSSTIAVAYLRGTKLTTGGIYEFQETPSTTNYPDHDRRAALTGGLGYRSRNGLWCLGSAQVLTGLKDSLDPTIYGPQPARSPVLTNIGLNMGYDVPKKIADKHRSWPSTFDVRIENLLNQRKALNLGSPYQGTRYTLPLRVMAGMYWSV